MMTFQMRSFKGSRPLFSAVVGGLAVLLLGCSGGSNTDVSVDAVEEWTETISTRPSTPSVSRTISPDGNWLATAGLELCIHSLADDLEPVCVSDPTIGADSISWHPDSTMLVTGGSTSGRFNTTGVWTMTTDGTLTSVQAVDEGNVITDEDGGEQHLGMAFRPDGTSIVFTDWSTEGAEIAEFDLDGSDRMTLLELGRGDVGVVSHLPLEDGRVIINSGPIGDRGVDLLDDSEGTRLIGQDPNDLGDPPLAIAATTTSDSFDDGAALVVGWNDGSRGFFKNDWWLVDFEGNEYPIETPEFVNIMSATLSPDGNYVAYVTDDLMATTPAREFHVIEVSAVVDGDGPVGSHTFENEESESWRFRGFTDSRVMRWTTDNRVLVALFDGDEAQVLEMDLNPSR